jgi:hypothetical protein
MLFGVSKIIGKPELEPGNWGPGFGSGFEKPKTRYPDSGTRFLVLGFYRDREPVKLYIYIYYFIFYFMFSIYKLTYSFLIYTNTKSMSKHRRSYGRD